MTKIAVIYKSNYGSTKKYAQWISEKLNADLFEQSEVLIDELDIYNTIVYGGGLYASGIIGSSFIKNNYEKLKHKQLIVFTVGLAATDDESIFKPIIDNNFSEKMQSNIKFFHLRGGINYKELSISHKLLMFLLKVKLSFKDKTSLSIEDKQFIATYGKVVNFISEERLKPLLAYVNNN